MPQRRYELSVWPTDKTPGWKLGSRVVPQGYTIRVERYVHVAYQPGSPEHLDLELQLTEDQVEAMREGSPSAAGWVLVPRPWLVLEVESSPTVPPRCVALRAADGISTPDSASPWPALSPRRRPRSRPGQELHRSAARPRLRGHALRGESCARTTEAHPPQDHAGASRRGRPHRRGEPTEDDRGGAAPLRVHTRLRAEAHQAR